MTVKEWLTVSEVSNNLNIPTETIRRYIHSHSVHLKVKKQHNRYNIHSESVTVLEQIRGLYAEGKNAEEVEETLSASGVSMTITVKNDDDERMTVNVADKLQGIKQALDEQKQFNKLLLERLDQQNKYINESLERRDTALLQAIRESQQARLETAASDSKPGFFKRIFGKK